MAIDRAKTVRIGVDIGGTFTDVLLLDDATGRYHVAKTLTTPENPTVGVIQAIESSLDASRVPAATVRNVIHGTTLVTNAIIQRRGARTALVTTRGFRDVLDIAREHRFDMYDLLLEQPVPLIAREDRFEVDERVFADGEVYRPLDLRQVDAVADEIRRREIHSVAVIFLHSFRNASHERLAGARLRECSPNLRTSLSSEVAGEIREYERASTTAANAYVQELVDRYLDELGAELQRIGFAGRLLIMLSNGGISTAETARRFPVRIVESGPAAGALAAAEVGLVCGHPSLLSFDMGGTTAKACLVENGHPFVSHEFEVDRRYRFKPGSGLPIKAPAIDMIEIGAGGGSIARVDQFDLIKVGPESAGASPGPACYGLGGERPTVTDADLVLGYLDPAFFLGGRMKLDVAAAERALGNHLAGPLGMTTTAAAWAVHQIVDESMASAARVHAVERGKDVRRFPLFAFGGAGPVHAFHVARILRLERVIAPFAAGVGSSLGFLAAPIAFDFVRGAVGILDRLSWSDVDRLYAEMEAEGRAMLADARVPPDEVIVSRSCDMRLAGQAHQISVAVPLGKLTSASANEVRRAFDDTYLGLFKRAAPGVPVEALNWRLHVSGPRPALKPFQASGVSDAKAATKGHRPIFMPEHGAFEDVPVYDRYLLGTGARIEGPAIVEERESTIVIGVGGRAVVDEWSNVVIDLEDTDWPG